MQHRESHEWWQSDERHSEWNSVTSRGSEFRWFHALEMGVNKVVGRSREFLNMHGSILNRVREQLERTRFWGQRPLVQP